MTAHAAVKVFRRESVFSQCVLPPVHSPFWLRMRLSAGRSWTWQFPRSLYSRHTTWTPPVAYQPHTHTELEHMLTSWHHRLVLVGFMISHFSPSESTYDTNPKSVILHSWVRPVSCAIKYIFGCMPSDCLPIHITIQTKQSVMNMCNDSPQTHLIGLEAGSPPM